MNMKKIQEDIIHLLASLPGRKKSRWYREREKWEGRRENIAEIGKNIENPLSIFYDHINRAPV